jgi:predicted nucleic acid-binding protein
VGVVLLDSGAIIAFLEPTDALNASAVAALTPISQQDDLIASVVTYAEVLAGVEAGHHARSIVQGFFQQIITRIEPLDTTIAERAAVLRAALKMPDALILATGELRADRVVTGDDKWPKVNHKTTVELLTP